MEPLRPNFDAQESLLGGAKTRPNEENLSLLFPEIIGNSDSLKQALQVVAKIAHSHSSVLILGESGTGKELVAASIHRLSSRNAHRFVAINCSAIPEDLLEAELFGHEKGAFTGADRKRIGLFGAAERGTVFLDEIGDMPPRLQSKLLRVLQEKTYSPIGSHTAQKVDVRIIAATNKDLEAEVAANRFRLDLFYRLNVLPITLPPLRDRAGDVDLLLDHYSAQMSRSHQIESPCWFSDAARTALQRHSWPGNVRELQNLVERMVVTTNGGRIDVDTLPPNLRSKTKQQALPETPVRSVALQNVNEMRRCGAETQLPQEGLDLGKFLERLENTLIMQALERTSNNKNQASKLLGLNRTTLVEKIKKRKLQYSPPD